MKKILMLALFISGINFSFAGTFYNGSETSFDNITLDEGINQIGPHNEKYLKVWGQDASSNYGTYGLTPGNNTPTSFPSPYSSYLKITCKNGKIVKVESSYTLSPNTLTGIVDSIIITYGTGFLEDKIEGSFVAKCKSITNPVKELVQNTIDINYKTISTTENNPFETLHIASATDPEITPTEVEEKLKAGEDIDTQPSFINILFLQLKTISNLSDIALTQNPTISFTGLFQTEKDFNEYNNWLDKFSAYSTKKEFEDAFSGAISLKDIGIANDVIKGLYSCINTNNCNGTIVFSHNISNKFDTYTFKEIEQSLYTGTNNILDTSIQYYSGLQDTCSLDNINSITDTFLKNQVQSICNKIFSSQIDTNSPELYDLGYSLGVRVQNLQNIKSGIGPKGLNLKGIFNIYWELNNLTLGAAKTKKIEKVIQEPTLTGKYESLKEVIQKDIEELEKGKIEDEELKEKLEILTNNINPEKSAILSELNGGYIEIVSEANLVKDIEGNTTLSWINEGQEIILGNNMFQLVGENNYDNPSNLGLGIGEVIYDSINSCYPKPDGDYFKDNNCSSSIDDDHPSNGTIGGLNYNFNKDGTFQIGDYTGIFLDNYYNDDYLRYKNLSLGGAFKIEFGIRGGALKKETGAYYLFKQPFGKQIYVTLYNGDLILGNYDGNWNNIISIDKDVLENLNTDNFYKIIATIDGENWALEIQDYNGNIIKKENIQTGIYLDTLKRLSIGGRFDDYGDNQFNKFDTGEGDEKNQWNDLIDYIKIYKKQTNSEENDD